MTPAGLVGVAGLLLVAATGDGVGLDEWTPIALGLLALLAVTAVTLGDQIGRVPAPVLATLGALAALCAWSYASILWAADAGSAWDGANRTLVYLLAVVLFGLWAQRPGSAALLLGLWTGGIVVLAVSVAVRVLGAGDLGDWFSNDRLLEPAGYTNAAAAMWLMAVWPCLALAGSDRLPVALRALFAGGVVLLVDLSLLSLSRGAILATPAVLLLFLAIVPGRLRHAALLVPVGIGLLATVPAVLDVGPALRAGAGAEQAVDDALTGVLIASAAVAIAVACGVVLGRRARTGAWLGDDTAARAQRAWGRAAVAGAVLGALAVLVVVGNPVERVDAAWDGFRSSYGARAAGESRLAELGSNRYDFYRAAVDTFADEPVHGVGADNYQGAYLRRGRSDESPRFAHSWPLGTLAQLGIVGGLIAVAWLVAAGWAAWRALRAPDALGVAVAGGALFVAVQFLAHGAGDWFWEYPPVALPAFAMLGLMLSLVPRAGVAPSGRGVHAAVAVGAVAGAAALAFVVAPPWLADRELGDAGRIWPQDPQGAYDRVDRAARLDPLSAAPYLTGGTIALRRGTVGIADRYFAAALARNPDSAYATLERGAIAGQRRDHARAVALLRRAVELDRRDTIAIEALRAAERGETLDVAQINTEILARSRAVGTG
ncbi:MAG: O-antigen ligase family protein [Solirubrobacteraceae bacterium]|nr:O-antigen ligase family protein [Solirubrobacteraceae bacterium]